MIDSGMTSIADNMSLSASDTRKKLNMFCMTLNDPFCADVPSGNYTHSLIHSAEHVIVVVVVVVVVVVESS